MEVKAEYRAIFSEEAREHLRGMGSRPCWPSSTSPADRELLNQMFRAIHTLKGSAGFIGFDELQKLAHDLESALQEVRDGAAARRRASSTCCSAGWTCARQMIDGFHRRAAVPHGDAESFLARAAAAQGTAAAARPAPAEPARPRPRSRPSPQRRRRHGGDPALPIGLLMQASGGEGFLRAFLVRNRLAGVGRIVSDGDPSPET